MKLPVVVLNPGVVVTTNDGVVRPLVVVGPMDHKWIHFDVL